RGPEGPVALPGTYLVRLTAGGRRLEAPLVIKEDPRVKLADGALDDQFHLAMKLADLLSGASRTLLAARSVHQQLASLAPGAAAAALAELLAPWRQLESELPALNSGLKALRLIEIRPELPPARDPNLADEN